MDVLQWLAEAPADVSIRYQARRDLLGEDTATLEPLRQRIAKEGWGERYLALRGENGHWGRAF